MRSCDFLSEDELLRRGRIPHAPKILVPDKLMDLLGTTMAAHNFNLSVFVGMVAGTPYGLAQAGVTPTES
jgi:hypothetical protein